MNNKGYRISAEVFTAEQFQQYKQFFESRSQYSIEIKGQPSKGRAMIYFAEMAYLLLESGIIAKNLDTNTEEILPGGQYAQSYIEGFNAGVAHFNERWSLKPDTLYGSKSDHYFNDLRAAYEGTGDQDTPLGIVSNAMRAGWLEKAGRIPLMINDESVKENGYYAGLVFKFREMQKQHDRLRDQPKPEVAAEEAKDKPFKGTLEEACVSEAAFRAARKYFIDHGYCDGDTLVFIKRGKITLGRLAGIIKGLSTKRYTYPLSNEEVCAIMNSTFKAKVGISTVEHASEKSLEIPAFLG